MTLKGKKKEKREFEGKNAFAVQVKAVKKRYRHKKGDLRITRHAKVRNMLFPGESQRLAIP